MIQEGILQVTLFSFSNKDHHMGSCQPLLPACQSNNLIIWGSLKNNWESYSDWICCLFPLTPIYTDYFSSASYNEILFNIRGTTIKLVSSIIAEFEASTAWTRPIQNLYEVWFMTTKKSCMSVFLIVSFKRYVDSTWTHDLDWSTNWNVQLILCFALISSMFRIRQRCDDRIHCQRKQVIWCLCKL